MSDHYQHVTNLVFTGEVELAKHLIQAGELDLQRVITYCVEEYHNHSTRCRIRKNSFKRTNRCITIINTVSMYAKPEDLVITYIRIGNYRWSLQRPKGIDHVFLFNHVLTNNPDER